MWITVLVIFISFAGYQFNDIQDCMKNDVVKCNRKGILKFPESKDGLDEVCNTLQQITECVISVAEQCGEQEITVLRMKKSVRFLKDMCDPESEIYNVIVNNLYCLISIKDGDYENYNPYRCLEITEQLMENSDEGYNNVCLYYSYYIACTVLAVEEECGSKAKDAVLSIMTNGMPDYLQHCSEDQATMMPEILYAFDTAAKEYDAFKER